MEVRINLGETGMRRALSLRIHVLFNLRCLMKPTQKVYLERYSLTSRRAGINFLPSLVPCTGSEKSVSPDILTFLKNSDHVNVSAEHLC